MTGDLQYPELTPLRGRVGVTIQQQSCVNNDGPARHLCTRCRQRFCERCAAYEINGGVFCEPCGNAAIEETSPRFKLGGIILACGWAGVVLLGVLEVLLIERLHWVIMILLFFAVGGAAARMTWHTTGDPPTVKRRHA